MRALRDTLQDKSVGSMSRQGNVPRNSGGIMMNKVKNVHAMPVRVDNRLRWFGGFLEMPESEMPAQNRGS